MKIGFVGYGNMARALSARWAPEHEVFIGGRNPEKSEMLMSEIGATGSGSVAEAVEFGNVVVLTIPADTVADAIEGGGGPDAFAGKTVIDLGNAISVPGGPHATDGVPYLPREFPEGSLAEHIAVLVPRAHVVKAFNMCQASVWAMNPPIFDGRRLVTLYCGGSVEAKAQVAALIESVGSEPVDIGVLEYARLLEAGAGLVIKLLFAGRDPHTVLNLIQPEAKPI